jgi:ABC-type multidrug transport system ATPase subunit
VDAVVEAIRLDNVTKRYSNGVVALHDVTISVPFGQRLTILGPNGAGKTTLVRIALGLLRPTAGDVLVVGRPHGRQSRRTLGYLPQMPGMYPDLLVQEFVDLAARLHRTTVGKDIVEAFGLLPYMRHTLGELSGGMQRRVSLAAAIIGRPKVLVLDEPTAGMDPLASREIRMYLRTWLAEATILLCTHDLKDAEDWATDLAILRHGKLMVYSPIADLRRDLPLALRIRTHEDPRGVADVVRHDGHRVTVVDDAIVVEVIGEPRTQASALLKVIDRAGKHVYECRIEEPTLEDIYVRELARV